IQRPSGAMMQGGGDEGRLAPLATLSSIAALAGAASSLGLMLRAGRTAPLLLKVLFAGCVSAPFAAFFLAIVVSRRWPAFTRAALYASTIVAAAVSVAIYAYVALGPPRERVAPLFVVVPPGSLLLTAIVVVAAGLISRGRG